MKSLLGSFTRKLVDLADGVVLGLWRMTLLNVDDTPALNADGTAVAPQVTDGASAFKFEGLPSGTYKGKLERLDASGNPYGTPVFSEPVALEQLQGEVPVALSLSILNVSPGP